MGKVLVDNDESWIYNRWRPMMAWLYMATCAFDFMIAPVFFAIIQASFHQPITQWQPLTLQGAGLYHLAMGSILGIAAWTRTQEKITAFNGGGGGMPINPFNPTPSITTATVTTDTDTPIPQQQQAAPPPPAANVAPPIPPPANIPPPSDALPPPKLRHPSS